MSRAVDGRWSAGRRSPTTADDGRRRRPCAAGRRVAAGEWAKLTKTPPLGWCPLGKRVSVICSGGAAREMGPASPPPRSQSAAPLSETTPAPAPCLDVRGRGGRRPFPSSGAAAWAPPCRSLPLGSWCVRHGAVGVERGPLSQRGGRWAAPPASPTETRAGGAPSPHPRPLCCRV